MTENQEILNSLNRKNTYFNLDIMGFTSVNKIFQEAFRKNWERPAISNYQGVTLKFGDVARRMEKLHIMFDECGLQKGDKVAIC